MKNNKDSHNIQFLREKAENQLNKFQHQKNADLTDADTKKLLHELQVHQIELEMMNEELSLARDKAENIAAKYEELYDFAPFGYLTLDSDGNIKELNLRSAKLLGMNRSILLSKNFKFFIDKDSKQTLDDFFSNVFTNNIRSSCELKLQAKENFSLYIYLEGNKTENAEDCFVTIIDITERKLLEETLKQTLEALKKSNADLKQFAYAASHDLKEPLRMISIYTAFLEKRFKGTLDGETGDYMGFIIDGTKRMHSLIDDIISYSTITSPTNKTSLTDLNLTIQEVLKNLKSSIAESGAEITTGKLPVINANSTQMVQLFQNLISNAIKFSGKEKPFIIVNVIEDEKNLIFSVKDNGIGIASKNFERIFMIFQRLFSKEEYPGTGIGLALCKQIVENLGGRIWVESEEGKGSTFYFTIPNSIN